MYLRVDSIEQAIQTSPGMREVVNEEGYRAAYAVAADNLRLGKCVISDSVNPVRESRDAWRDVSRLTHSSLLEIEIVCSDAEIHRRRVETREASIDGLALPTWDEVLARLYHPWNRNHLVLDTAHRQVADCVEEIETAIMKGQAYLRRS